MSARRRRMPCWKLDKDGVSRTAFSCGLPDELLCEAAEKWPLAEIEVVDAGRYSLMPGFGETGIPLGAGPAEAEATLRTLLKV